MPSFNAPRRFHDISAFSRWPLYFFFGRTLYLLGRTVKFGRTCASMPLLNRSPRLVFVPQFQTRKNMSQDRAVVSSPISQEAVSLIPAASTPHERYWQRMFAPFYIWGALLAAISDIPSGFDKLEKTLLRHPGARERASGVDDLLASTLLLKTCGTGSLSHTV